MVGRFKTCLSMCTCRREGLLPQKTWLKSYTVLQHKLDKKPRMSRALGGSKNLAGSYERGDPQQHCAFIFGYPYSAVFLTQSGAGCLSAGGQDGSVFTQGDGSVLLQECLPKNSGEWMMWLVINFLLNQILLLSCFAVIFWGVGSTTQHSSSAEKSGWLIRSSSPQKRNPFAGY